MWTCDLLLPVRFEQFLKCAHAVVRVLSVKGGWEVGETDLLPTQSLEPNQARAATYQSIHRFVSKKKRLIVVCHWVVGFFKVLFIFLRERESKHEHRGRRRSRLPAEQGTWCRAWSQDSEIMTWAEGRRLPDWATQEPLPLSFEVVCYTALLQLMVNNVLPSSEYIQNSSYFPHMIYKASLCDHFSCHSFLLIPLSHRNFLFFQSILMRFTKYLMSFDALNNWIKLLGNRKLWPPCCRRQHCRSKPCKRSCNYLMIALGSAVLFTNLGETLDVVWTSALTPLCSNSLSSIQVVSCVSFIYKVYQ